MKAISKEYKLLFLSISHEKVVVPSEFVSYYSVLDCCCLF